MSNNKFCQVGLSLTIIPVLFCNLAVARQPTEYEQYMLELINRARLNPTAEVVRLGTGSLNEGPPTLGGNLWTIAPGPYQPLAFNLALLDAAGSYASQLNDADTFCHTCLGSTPESRMAAATYALANVTGKYGTAGGYVPGRENLAFYAEGPANGVFDNPALAGKGLTQVVSNAHKSLFNDFTVASRGHRSTMLYGEWREAGIGISTGPYNGGTYDSFYMVSDLAHQAGNPLLTGVAYKDLDGDNFYTPGIGEALGGLTVQAFRAGTLVGSTATFRSGGYSLRLPLGSYDVLFSGPGLSKIFTFTAVNFNADKNVKLDLQVKNGSSGTPPPPVSPPPVSPPVAMTVIKIGTGAGMVSSGPAGINCGTDCAENYPKNTIVTLTATAYAQSTFYGWSGACYGTGVCKVTMNAAKSVQAMFYKR